MDYKRVECFPTIIKSDCCEYEELISLTTHGNDQLSVGQMTIEIYKAIPQFSYLHTKESGSNHEDQKFQVRSNLQLEHQEDPPYPYEYVVSNNDEGKDQQHKEVFPIVFYDPVANYLELMSNIDIKIFLSEESWFYQLFKTHFYWLCILLFFGSRLSMMSVNQFLTWLHWNHDFT